MRRLQNARQFQLLSAALVFSAALWPGLTEAEPVALRYTEGAVHGFLVLRTLDDKLLAEGDVTQTVDGDRVPSGSPSTSRTVRSTTRRPSIPSVSVSN